MARRSKAPVTRKGSQFRLNLDHDEIELLRRLLAELRALMLGPGNDPRLRRLFPTAYHQAEDIELDQEFQRLMREELVSSRLTGIETVTAVLESPDNLHNRRGAIELSQAQVLAFMQAINGLRLILGTLLDVQEDQDLATISTDDPMIGEQHLYAYLSWILESCVDAMSAT